MMNKKPTSSEPEVGEGETNLPVLTFVYPPAPGWNAEQEDKSLFVEALRPGTSVPNASSGAEGGIRPEEGSRVREKQTWDEGFREGFARAHADTDTAVNQQRVAISKALEDFARDREAYFRHVEGEVVALALSIVRKILRRESQVDPLLLGGLVRVALEKMASTHNVKLRVHPSQVSIWQDHFSHHADLPTVPEIVADEAIEGHQCRIESELGEIDLNLETQLKEIEQGLFDLLSQRPAPR
jgi:flagellar biosynthesis/type III secretory pathway protein FliH